MSIATALAAVAALGAGTVGAVTAYQVAAPEPAPEPVAVGTTQQRPAAERPRFAPCEPPAELRGKRCVADVTRTVVVPSPLTTPTAPATSPPDGRHHARHSGDDDGFRDDDNVRHGGEDEDDHHGDDDRDDRDDSHRDDGDDHDDGDGDDSHHGGDDDRDDD